MLDQRVTPSHLGDAGYEDERMEVTIDRNIAGGWKWIMSVAGPKVFSDAIVEI